MRPFILALACLLTAPAAAQTYTQMCVEERGNVICRVQIHSFPRTGDPVFTVLVSVLRTVPSTRIAARVFATDCGTMREQRNYVTLGAGEGGPVAQFNWPVALQDRPRRCVEIEMSECRRITDEAVFCGAVIDRMRSRGTVRF